MLSVLVFFDMSKKGTLYLPFILGVVALWTL